MKLVKTRMYATECVKTDLPQLQRIISCASNTDKTDNGMILHKQ